MAVDHYENFPVASVLLPRHLRRPVAVLYRFARTADDIADEGTVSAQERLDALEAFEEAVLEMSRGRCPKDPPLSAAINALRPSSGWLAGDIFPQLAEITHRHQLPTQCYLDLLSAFKQDITVHRYAKRADLLDYCARSANPVGRLMLALFQCDTPANVVYSDRICTSLQLINFAQDVTIDSQKGRIYVPQDEMARAHVSESAWLGHPSHALAPREFTQLLGQQAQYAAQLMSEGEPLVQALPFRFRWEIRAIIQGGRRVLDKMASSEHDVWCHRPKLGKADLFPILWAAMRMQS